MKTYNINELLERKKELEEQVKDELTIDKMSLQFVEQVITDHLNAKNNKTITQRERVDLVGFSQKFNGMVEELAKVKTSIQKYNAETLLGKLHDRDSIRSRIAYLKRIKESLLKEKQYQRKVSREGKEGEPLETTEVTVEPMFKRTDVETMLNQLAAQERKVNTEMQKLNLNATIEL